MNDFSLTDCGPVDRALARAGLTSGESPRALLRALLPALIVWLPLAALAWLSPAHEGGNAVGFFQDLATHVRFLVFVPLLIIVEASIGRRTRQVAAQFIQAELVASADHARFSTLLRQASRAINSTIVELAIGTVAITLVWLAVRKFETDGILLWAEEAGDAGVRLNAAGWWYAIGSVLPPFLLLRWAWRYLVWCWLLYRWSRLELRLVGTHPDLAGGLEFVGFGHASFAGLAFAVSCVVSAVVGTHVLHEGAALADYQVPLVVFVGLAVIVGVAPLVVFWRPLRTAKEAGFLAYGAFASRYVQGFNDRWISAENEKAPLDAVTDISGLADVGGGFERVYAMRLLPVTMKTALAFAGSTVVPLLPLLLTVMPLRDLVKLLMKAMI
jgi:hypothetical protein